MAQFDVHRNRDVHTRDLFPYLLDVQTDMLDRLATRVVAPLALAAGLGALDYHLTIRAAA